MTSRRDVLKGLIVSIGGATLLGSCKGVPAVALSESNSLRYYSQHEFALVSRLSDLLFPRTDTPGAIDTQVPEFLDGLMNEWADAETSASHHAMLAELDNQLGTDFSAVTLSAAEQTLREFDAQAYASNNRRYSGYRGLKGLIYQAYFATEEGALQELEWVAVPGRWDPSVPV